MSPPMEMLTLLNRNWKVRFLMRSKRVVNPGARCFLRKRAPTRDAPTGEGVGCGWNVIGPMLHSMGRKTIG